MDWLEIDREVVTIFTDGSCWPNPNGKGGWAFVGMWRDRYIEKSGHLHSTTNNIAELTAVHMALHSVLRDELPILIITDSKYVYRSFTFWVEIWKKHNWLTAIGEPVANAKLICGILQQIEARRGSVTFQWMKGHTKEKTPHAQFNARADELASAARKKC